jgi:hypothetical protein
MVTLTRALIAAAAIAAVATPGASKPGHCPPGLAKKAVPCVPPGLAAQGVRADDRGWQIGERLAGAESVLIPRDEWDRLRLRAYDDSHYALVDRDILRVARDTLIVLEAIRIVDRALD